MSDDRLFVSNNPIGRKWYFINIIILLGIYLATNYSFTQYIIPNTKTAEYHLIAQVIMYFLYLIYIVTFFALIDRRLYDITGDRDSVPYKTVSRILSLIILYEIFITAVNVLSAKLPPNIIALNILAAIFVIIFVIITFLLCFFKGKISGKN